MRPGTRGECSEGPATDGRAFDRLVGVAEVEVRCQVSGTSGCRGGVPVPGERHLVVFLRFVALNPADFGLAWRPLPSKNSR